MVSELLFKLECEVGNLGAMSIGRGVKTRGRNQKQPKHRCSRFDRVLIARDRVLIARNGLVKQRIYNLWSRV